jgi:transcriptional regulator with XRE-family HTH domain
VCTAIAPLSRPRRNVDILNITESKDPLFPTCNGPVATCYESSQELHEADVVLKAQLSCLRQEDAVTTVIAASAEGAIDLQAERIGGRIRELRRARGLTLVQLAGISDLSHPFLSQLERGRARPSMGSLERIARALGSSQLELIAAAEDDSPDQADVVVVRADEGTRGPYGDGEGRLLVHGRRRFHPMEFVGSNQVPGEYYEHEGDEFLTVVSGVIAVDLEGRESSVLSPGDSIYFEGGIRHRWRAVEPGGYRLFVVKEKPELP